MNGTFMGHSGEQFWRPAPEGRDARGQTRIAPRDDPRS
jgi:hypothetical protein